MSNSETYFTYIALCNDKSLYTGITNDIQKREARHNAGYGSIYTRSRRPIKIIYFEECKTRQEACKREYEIKSWTRKNKIALINKKSKTN